MSTRRAVVWVWTYWLVWPGNHTSPLCFRAVAARNMSCAAGTPERQRFTVNPIIPRPDMSSLRLPRPQTPTLNSQGPPKAEYLPARGLLGGSCVVTSRVISRVSILITHIRGLITLLITTHEPPSNKPCCKFWRLGAVTLELTSSSSIGALMIGRGFWGPIIIIIRNPQNSIIGNYLGPYGA